MVERAGLKQPSFGAAVSSAVATIPQKGELVKRLHPFVEQLQARALHSTPPSPNLVARARLPFLRGGDRRDADAPVSLMDHGVWEYPCF
eukprot:scaffold105543_cov30-Tisochrysis_lutea.AAC.1